MIKSIPNAITVGNLLFGFLSILIASYGEYRKAVLFIFIGMILDALDGRAARLLKVQSEIGKELDSLADVITFGVAPTFILYHILFQEPNLLGMICLSLFPICGALRLARFNISGSKITHYFVGLPITAAGVILAVYTMFADKFEFEVSLIVVFILSGLMISKIKHPSFKHLSLPKSSLIVIPFIFVAVFFTQKLFPVDFYKVLSVPLVIYIIFILYQTKKKVARKKEEIQDDEPKEDYK